ncbi:MAG TPA: hypothetical protein VMT16_01075 [Thermoanaerobaculia bacterium]|nr:hypothetical protein [Thermoanaerobaculia bacterium]
MENGVRCIEHGLLLADETARLVADNDIAISTQLVVFSTLQDLPGITPNNLEKLRVVGVIRFRRRYCIMLRMPVFCIHAGADHDSRRP